MPQSPSPADGESLKAGIDQFNQGEYYACHDTLEAIWMEAATFEKAFFQGILQLAVALHHLGNHNWRGAAILLGEGIRRLEPFEPDYRNVNVTALLDCADEWLAALQELGPEQVAVLATALESSQGKMDSSETTTLPGWKIQPSS